MQSDYRDAIALSFLGKTEGHVIPLEFPESWHPISHDDILLAAKELKSHPEWTLDMAKQILKLRFPIPRADEEVELAINISIQMMSMVDTRASKDYSPSFRIGKYRPTSWRADETLAAFLSRSFFRQPAVGRRRSDDDDDDEENNKIADVLDEKSSMKAWKLARRLGVTFRHTDNLARHLLFDRRHKIILHVFCHAAFLKAQLESAMNSDVPKNCSIVDSLKVGTLPPRLLAETLHSIQSILFPFADQRSQAILDELIASKAQFDPDCAHHEGYKMFEDSENDFTYTFWGERLSVLHEVVVNRPPKNKIESWIRWHTSEANAFMVALVALLISIGVGILSLGLSAFQAWVAWQQWTNPYIIPPVKL